MLLEETDYLEPFQLGLRHGHGTEMALITLVDELWQQKDESSVSSVVSPYSLSSGWY